MILYMIHPKKSLGQNFLINQGIVEKIISAAELSKNDTVLEVGPGKGVLTEELVKYAGRVIAVEKDKHLFEMLQEKFQGVKNLELINEDIFTYNLQATNYKLIANIPYNITGQFFRKFLLPPPSSSLLVLQGGGGRHRPVGDVERIPPLTPPLDTRGEKNTGDRPQMIVVMVQKEVGERLFGKNKSILSITAELYGRAEKVCDVSPGSFSPPPKIMSSVIKMVASPSSLLPLGKGEEGWGIEKKVMRLARIGFASRRKKLISNLSTGLKIGKDKIKQVFNQIGLNENARAEELSLSDWLKLAELI